MTLITDMDLPDEAVVDGVRFRPELVPYECCGQRGFTRTQVKVTTLVAKVLT